MTPLQAAAKYTTEWPVLNAAKQAAVARGDVKAARQCRQKLSLLSGVCRARHDLNVKVKYDDECPTCGATIAAGERHWA